MRLTITIDCNNAAYDRCPMAAAFSDIEDAIRPLFGRTRNDLLKIGTRSMRDINGNRIGEIQITEEA